MIIMKTKKEMTIGIDDYIKANKKLAREEELQRNGGRWVAKDRPHKNLKKYDRKRDKKNFDPTYLSFLSLYINRFTQKMRLFIYQHVQYHLCTCQQLSQIHMVTLVHFDVSGVITYGIHILPGS